MLIEIPTMLINAFWGSIGTAIAGGVLIFLGIRSGKIPLWWGNMKDSTMNYLTPEQFDHKLAVHCVAQHREFQNSNDSKLESIFAAQNRILDKIDKMRETQTDILQRISRIEGSMSADHK